MKTSGLIIICSSIMFMFIATSCSKVKGDGDVISQQREIASFSGVTLAMDAKVNYRYGENYAITVTAQENILSVVETRIENDILVIKYEDGKVIGPHQQVVVDVSAPFSNYFLISGSGSMFCEGIDSVNRLDLTIEGSGDLEVRNFDTPDLFCTISGSGNLRCFAGNAVTETATITGSGNIDLGDVLADTAYATISGSGNMTLNVQKLLDATITGSGNINYYGTPVIVKNITGSGSVIKL